jgi:dipeptidyl aminopeptidase/acylaminoacyl peptidase
MSKEFIKNRNDKKICVVVEQPEGKPKGPAFAKASAGKLAFVMHGLGGFKEQPHIRAMIESFLENGYTAVSFDATHTFGESEGKYEDATTTNYLEDLEDVINWSESQSFYTEPFCLAGHSLGAFAVALYTEKYPNKVKALAPISTVVSGKLSAEASSERGLLEEWKRTGWLSKPSESIPGLIKKLKWTEMEDRLKYDILPEANKLTMPVLLIVGDLDKGTPFDHQKMFYDKLSGKKDLHVIKESPHTFRQPQHLKKLKDIFVKWIKSLI